MAVDYKKKIGFKRPVLHRAQAQGADQAPVRLRRRQPATPSCRSTAWSDDFKLNIEANHATLAGHTFQHELEFAAANGILGSVDANRGDLLLGWDTDQFPTDLYDTTLAMYIDPQGRRLHDRRPELRRQGPPRSRSTRRTSSTPTSAAWTPSPAA